MGIFSYVKLGKKIFGKQKTTGETINPFKANPQTKESKSKIATAKSKGKFKGTMDSITRDAYKTGAAFRRMGQKLDNKQITESGFNKAKDLAKGGRVNYRAGNPKPKTNVQKIKETFSPKGKNLKPVDPKKQKGLAKLPKQVRNKMGYMKSGGRAGFKGGSDMSKKPATVEATKKAEKRMKAAGEVSRNQGRSFRSIQREKYMR